jgi:hypothetical protein
MPERLEIKAMSDGYRVGQKKFTNKSLSSGAFLPHVVGP